jgi:hypothetical protein
LIIAAYFGWSAGFFALDPPVAFFFGAFAGAAGAAATSDIVLLTEYFTYY